MKIQKLSLVLCALLTASIALSSCGSDAGTGSGSNPSATSSDASSQQPEAALDEITFLTKDYYTTPEYAQKLEAMFQEKTGVTLTIKHVPSNNWEEKITASFVSGDLPDIARISNDVYPMVKQEFIVPLDSYIAENAAMSDLFEQNSGVIEPFQFFDSTYAVSVTNQKSMNVWVRGDWMDELGVESPNSMEEFTNLLTLFRDSDLDGNGKDDTIPLTLSATLKDYDCIAAAFGVRGEIFMKDGKAYNPFPTEDFKEYMDYMKMLYEEGLIDKEAPTNTSYGTIRTKFHTSVAGSIIMWDDIYDNLKNGLVDSNTPNGTVEPLKAFETDKGMFGYSYYEADSPIAITSGCENPKEVFDTFFTWYFTDPDAIMATSRGIEGYSYDIVDGTMVPNQDNGGVGFKGQSMPPVMKDFEYPFNLGEVNQAEYDYILELGKIAEQNLDKIQTTPPSHSCTAYYNIKGDLLAKMQDLFFNYMMGKINYDEYLAAYNDYAAEINLDSILAEINQ